MTVDLTAEMATKRLTEYDGQRDDSRPGQDRAGQHEISSCYLEWRTMKKRMNCLFLESSILIFSDRG